MTPSTSCPDEACAVRGYPLVICTKDWFPRTGVNSRGGLVTLQHSSEAADSDGTRRTEVLETAASLIGSSGLRSSLQQIADAAGILAGSLYHHFESKEAILVELIRRYHADLDRIGEIALERLDEADPRPAPAQITALGFAIARCAVEHRAA